MPDYQNKYANAYMLYAHQARPRNNHIIKFKGDTWSAWTLPMHPYLYAYINERTGALRIGHTHGGIKLSKDYTDNELDALDYLR